MNLFFLQVIRFSLPKQLECHFSILTNYQSKQKRQKWGHCLTLYFFNNFRDLLSILSISFISPGILGILLFDIIDPFVTVITSKFTTLLSIKKRILFMPHLEISPVWRFHLMWRDIEDMEDQILIALTWNYVVRLLIQSRETTAFHSCN